MQEALDSYLGDLGQDEIAVLLDLEGTLDEQQEHELRATSYELRATSQDRDGESDVAGLAVVDTDLIIDFLRGRGPGAPLTRRLVVERRLRLTAVTSFELTVGTDFLAREDQIPGLFRSRTVPLDLASVLQAGEVASALRANGVGIWFADCMQAGICLRHGLPFATRNRKHFERVEGLHLVDIEAS